MFPWRSVPALRQGAPKIFLSTCPEPKGSCPKCFAQNSKQSGIYFTAYYHIISLFAGKLTCLVTKARFLNQIELVKKQMIEMAVEWRSFKGIFNLILTSMRLAFMTIT